MYFSEFIEAMARCSYYYEVSAKETVELMEDMIKDIAKNPDKYLNKLAEEYFKDLDCTVCGESLTYVDDSRKVCGECGEWY